MGARPLVLSHKVTNWAVFFGGTLVGVGLKGKQKGHPPSLQYP